MELEAPRMPTAPTVAPPAGACDSHSHVFGPYDRFPLALPSAYPPPDAPFEVHQAMTGTLGLDRAVLIQPAPYSTDNSALVDALQRAGGRLRGVGVIDREKDEEELQAMHAAGVRAVRFLEMRIPGTDKRYPGSVGADQLRPLAARLAGLGWHAEIWGDLEQCSRCADDFADLGIPVVFDHMAGVNQDSGVDSTAFRNILQHLREGNVWVKLSLCRFSVKVADYAGARPFHDALVGANPGRVVWGTDFPYVRRGENSPDGGHLLNLLHEWVGDAGIERGILVENPEDLYDFGR